MLRERLGIGIRAGLVAAAATVGVLVGLGRARGSADLAITSMGLLAHVASVVLWAVLFALVAARLRRVRLLGAALLLAAVAYVVDYLLLPSSLSPGFEAVLSSAEIATVYLALAISLAAGLHVARAESRR